MLLTQGFTEWLRDPEVLLNHLLNTYGVWMVASTALIVFIGSGVLFPVLPGDSMLFAIGLPQNRMPMSLTVIYLAVTTAAICGGQVGYWFSLFFGEKFFKDDTEILKTEYLKPSRVFFSKWGGPAVVLGHFIPLIRTSVPITTETGHYHWLCFTLWNAAGAVAWTLTFVVTGVLPGDIPLVRDNVEVIAVIIIVFSVLPIAVGLVKEHLDVRRCTTRLHNTA